MNKNQIRQALVNLGYTCQYSGHSRTMYVNSVPNQELRIEHIKSEAQRAGISIKIQ